MYVVFLLEIMSGATPLPELFETLVELVRDDTRLPLVRRRGIEAIIEGYEPSETKKATLAEIIEGVRAGIVEDPDNEVLGATLYELYPKQIGPQEIWEYLDSPASPFYAGSFRLFWERGIIELSSLEPQVLLSLLDSLSENDEQIHRMLRRHHLEHLPAGLLADALVHHGNLIASRQLYEWLSIPGLQAPRSAECLAQILQWLAQHPEVQKEIILSLFDEGDRGENYWERLYIINRSLEVRSPADLGHWCLTEALKAPNSPMAKELLARAAGTLVTGLGTNGLSLDILFEKTGTAPGLQAALQSLLICSVTQDYLERRRQGLESRSQDIDAPQKNELFQEVRSHELALRSREASLGLLWQLGNEYVQRYEEFAALLGNDQDLIDAALEGLMGTVQRDDIPDVEGIIQTAIELKSYCISVSFLAGMAELGRGKADQVQALTETKIKKALAFFYCDNVGSTDPDWYQWCVGEKPEIVAEILEQCAEAAIQAGLKHIPGLSFLANRENHSLIAKSVSISLLKKFVPGYDRDLMPGLDLLLRAALRHADRAELLRLILEKTSLQCLNPLQRIHWLAAGALLAPEEYLDDLEQFCAANDDRIRELASALELGGHSLLGATEDFAQLPAYQRINILVTLVGLLAKYFGPVQFEGGRISQDFDTQKGIGQLIQELASSPDESAGHALRDLEARPDLANWQLHLEDARKRHEAVRRDASFVHPSPFQVLYTLNNSLPANAGDLASLIVEHIEELADEIRNGNTDDWRQYWNEGPHPRVKEPRHEDTCRDTLLSDLKQRIPRGIAALPEGHYADDKRADISTWYGAFNVPIEIKKNMHRDLWRALRGQLIRQYTREPGAEGIGIYLVFWFGPEFTTPPLSDERPATPEQLRQRLEQDLTATEARKIFVRVIDVSAPSP